MDFNFDVEIEKIKSGQRGREIKQEKLVELQQKIVNSVEKMKQDIKDNQPYSGCEVRIDRYRGITNSDVQDIINYVIKYYNSSLRKYISIKDDYIRISYDIKVNNA